MDPILVEEIARRLDEPEALEALFRRDPEPFRAALGAVASAHPDSLVVRVWKARLDAEVVPPSARKSDAGVDVHRDGSTAPYLGLPGTSTKLRRLRRDQVRQRIV